MAKAFPFLVFCLVLTGGLSAPLPATATAIFGYAETVIENLGVTEYQNEAFSQTPLNQQVYINAQGQYTAITDCSGWVSYVLSTVAPVEYQAVYQHKNLFPTEINAEYPRAFVYQDYFSILTPQSSSFNPVSQLALVQAGDILAWCTGPACQGQNPNSVADTGHVMIIAGSPVPWEGPIPTDKALNPKVKQIFAVPVFDSSAEPHFSPSAADIQPGFVYFPNIRQFPPAGQGGVGFGYINFAVDSTGKAIQHAYTASDTVNPHDGQVFCPSLACQKSGDTYGYINIAKPVPEPLTMLGSVVAAAWGVAFKQKVKLT
jgi:hypothetical protein